MRVGQPRKWHFLPSQRVGCPLQLGRETVDSSEQTRLYLVQTLANEAEPLVEEQTFLKETTAMSKNC